MSERAAAFRLWLDNPCWGDVKAMIEDIRERSIRNVDSVSTADLNVNLICEARGVRKGLSDLLRKISEAAEK